MSACRESHKNDSWSHNVCPASWIHKSKYHRFFRSSKNTVRAFQSETIVNDISSRSKEAKTSWSYFSTTGRKNCITSGVSAREYFVRCSCFLRLKRKASRSLGIAVHTKSNASICPLDEQAKIIAQPRRSKPYAVSCQLFYVFLAFHCTAHLPVVIHICTGQTPGSCIESPNLNPNRLSCGWKLVLPRMYAAIGSQVGLGRPLVMVDFRSR